MFIQKNQNIPFWSGFNSALLTKKCSKQITGFLPVVPHSAKKYETVKTVLDTFLSVLKQLRQDFIPVA